MLGDPLARDATLQTGALVASFGVPTYLETIQFSSQKCLIPTSSLLHIGDPTTWCLRQPNSFLVATKSKAVNGFQFSTCYEVLRHHDDNNLFVVERISELIVDIDSQQREKPLLLFKDIVSHKRIFVAFFVNFYLYCYFFFTGSATEKKFIN